MKSGIKQKPGSFGNNGNMFRYNINYTKRPTSQCIFPLPNRNIEKASHSLLAYFLLSDIVSK